MEIGQALGLKFQQQNFCNFRDMEFNEEVGCGDLDKKKKIEWHRYVDQSVEKNHEGRQEEQGKKAHQDEYSERVCLSTPGVCTATPQGVM